MYFNSESLFAQVATVPWIQRQICNTFFGRVPDATLAEAMQQLDEADRLLREQRGPNARSKDIILYRAKVHYITCALYY